VCRSNGYRLETLCFYTLDFSALFHPFSMYWIHGFTPIFIAKEQLTTDSFWYAGYIGVVLLYLAAPLVVRIVRQVTALLRPAVKVYLQPGAWRV
ncbi:MAG TPA: hypothetical protein VMV29_13135, partial [Ktedonobacterales bacterium]|nr:hypothetical protein [Ktedonobacterales bacterium]